MKFICFLVIAVINLSGFPWIPWGRWNLHREVVQERSWIEMPWGLKSYALRRASIYSFQRVEKIEPPIPYWIRKEKERLLPGYPLCKHVPVEVSTHMIQAARQVLQLSWNYTFSYSSYRLGLKVGREYNVVFDHYRWEKRIEDTAIYLKGPPPGEDVWTQIPFPGVLLGLRFDF